MLRQRLRDRKHAIDQLHKKSGQNVVTNVDVNQFEQAVKQFKDSGMIDVRLSSPRSKAQERS